MISEPREQFLLLNVGRSIADDFARGRLRVQLYFGGCRPGELAHSAR